MRGVLATLGSYTLSYPHGRKLEVGADRFCEDRERFMGKLKEIESRKEYDTALNKYRKASKAFASEKAKYFAINEETENSALISLHRNKQDIHKRIRDKDEITVAFGIEMAQMKEDLTCAEREVIEASESYGEDSEQYAEAYENLQLLKKLYKAKNRSFSGKIERLTLKIAEMNEAINTGNREKKKLLNRQKNVVMRAEARLKQCRKELEAVMESIAGPEISVPGKILSLIRKDPDMSAETVNKIISLTPNFTHNDWDICFDPGMGTQMLITECIHDNINQSMAELIVRVANARSCQFTDAMIILTQLRENHQLFYIRHFASGGWNYFHWEPGPVRTHCERPSATDASNAAKKTQTAALH